MKKFVIGALVGAIIIFIWQFVSFAALNLHKPAQQYTEKQDAIMSFLNSQGLKEGGYILPSLPEGSSMEEHNNAMKAAEGKPWAVIQYHSTLEDKMVMNMVRGFLVDFAVVLLFCWLVGKMAAPTMKTIVTSALVVGLITFLFQPYTGNIWYEYFDIWVYLLDAIVCWGLTGLWLGWWLGRGSPEMSKVRIGKHSREVA